MRAVGVALAVALVLWGAPCWAATQVLVKTGDVAADADPLDTIGESPKASGSTIAFAGGTSAVLRAAGGAPTTVARTGDPLPPPLEGTFDRLSASVAINDDGAIAFGATLNSRSASTAIFLADPSGLLPITNGGALVSGIVADLNRRDDVLYTSGRTIWLWNRAGGKAVRLAARGEPAPGGGSFDRFGRPVLNANGVVAFVATVRDNAAGVFTAAAGQSPSPVAAFRGSRSVIRRAFRQPVAINERGDVAFITPGSVGGAFLFSPAAALVTPVAVRGEAVGSGHLTGFSSEFVGVDSRGRVAFVGLFADGARLVLAADGALAAITGTLDVRLDFAPRLTDSGRAVWLEGSEVREFDGTAVQPVVSPETTPLGSPLSISSPSVNERGTIAFAARRDAIYEWSDGAVGRTVSVGDALEGGGTIARIDDHVVHRDVLAVRAADQDGRVLLAVRRGQGPLVKVVADGDPTPLGGTFSLEYSTFDARAGRVVLASEVDGGSTDAGLFEVDLRRRAIHVIASTGEIVSELSRLAFIGQVSATPGGSLFVGGLDDGRSGVFASVRRRPVPVLLGGRAVASVGSFVARGGSVLFDGVRAGPSGQRGIFLWRAGRLQTAFLEATGSLTLATPIGLRGGKVVLVAAGPPRSIFVHGGRSTRRLVGEGDAVLGGAIASIGVPAAEGPAVVLAASLDDALVQAALLRAGPQTP